MSNHPSRLRVRGGGALSDIPRVFTELALILVQYVEIRNNPRTLGDLGEGHTRVATAIPYIHNKWVNIIEACVLALQIEQRTERLGIKEEEKP